MLLYDPDFTQSILFHLNTDTSDHQLVVVIIQDKEANSLLIATKAAQIW
jgi:hypothetical protein